MKNCTTHHYNEKAMNQFFQSLHLTKTRVCIFIGSLNLTLMHIDEKSITSSCIQ